MTALMMASECGHTEAAKILLDKYKADVKYSVMFFFLNNETV